MRYRSRLDSLVRRTAASGVMALQRRRKRALSAAALQKRGCRPPDRLRDARLHRRARPRCSRRREDRAGASEHELSRWLDAGGVCGWFETEIGRAATAHLLRGLAFAEFARFVCTSRCGVRPRHGIGRARAAARLHEARERGCTAAVLAPSADGAKLYEALAFGTY